MSITDDQKVQIRQLVQMFTQTGTPSISILLAQIDALTDDQVSSVLTNFTTYQNTFTQMKILQSQLQGLKVAMLDSLNHVSGISGV